MNDLLALLLSALGAVAGAAAILSGLIVCGAVVTSVVGGVASATVTALPVVACAGGVAYAASKATRDGFTTSE